ncbi:MAG: CaiB/BaiF CoA-transferase family protein [Chloroflexi bacterium]|nr:CaiB/BaiF CoA-transferase family protein [Chloroflexota bacterium]
MTMALEGVRVLDLSRTPPGQYASMLLADFGADVLMVEVPPGAVARFEVRNGPPETDEEATALAHQALRRNKRSAAINLRDEDGQRIFRSLVERSDVVVDGFRPGVTTRLGIDYERLTAINPRIITCSVSGFGRTGPYEPRAGHDINYISIGGALGSIGNAQGEPVLPLNIIADFAGGGLMAAFGILLALQARERTGRGQDVDAAMSDGVASLMVSHVAAMLAGAGPPRRGDHALAGALCYYQVYECADGRWISVGAIEPYFFEELCRALGFEEFVPHQDDPDRQAEMAAAFAARFRERPRDAWFADFGHLDACLTPVLDLDEMMDDPHQQEREMALDVEDEDAGTVRQVGVAPKLLGTPGNVRSTAAYLGQHTDEVLAELGESAESIAALKERGVVA